MANNSMPSMVALLGLLAVAGYQNRDKIAEMLRGAGARAGGTGASPDGSGGLGGMLSGLGDLIGGQSARNPAGTVSGGLGDLVDSFRRNGQGDIADSWVQTGPNRTLTPDQVGAAIGEDNLRELSSRTGLSREELLQRLATNIPHGVDQLTPEGKVPTETEAKDLLGLNRAA